MTKDEQTQLNDNLFKASENGRLAEVKDLIEKGAEVAARDKWDWTPLHRASARGRLDVVKYLVEEAHAEVDAREQWDRTPLHKASENGNLEVVKYLVEEAHAEVAARDKWDQTPLHFASLTGRLEVVKILCENCDNIDARDEWDRTPLHFASLNGHLEVVKYLFLEQNALMPILGMFKYYLLLENMGRKTKAQNILDYFLLHKNKYKLEEIKEFKKEFLDCKMSEEDSKNLKPIVKFL